jgi:hypothetical protein
MGIGAFERGGIGSVRFYYYCVFLTEIIFAFLFFLQLGCIGTRRQHILQNLPVICVGAYGGIKFHLRRIHQTEMHFLTGSNYPFIIIIISFFFFSFFLSFFFPSFLSVNPVFNIRKTTRIDPSSALYIYTYIETVGLQTHI